MTLINAHRGDPIGYRENTMEAFQSAIALGADMIELDVKPSRDGKAVILHDDTLTRLWNIPHRVRDLSYDEIRRLSDTKDGHIPLFEEVLNATSTSVMVDFTEVDTVDCIVETINRMQALERCLIVTGNIPALREVRRQLPEATLGLTWNDAFIPSDELIAELSIAYFNPDWRLLERGFTAADSHPPYDGQEAVDFFHKQNILVSCWTVDKEADMAFVKSLGVDAITTNDTRKLLEVLHHDR